MSQLLGSRMGIKRMEIRLVWKMAKMLYFLFSFLFLCGKELLNYIINRLMPM